MKDQVAKELGLPDDRILANWLHAIAVLRNCCAHHSRIWNRRYIVSVKLSYNTTYPFIDRDTIKLIRSNKLFAVLSCIKYFSDIISPGSDLKRNFLSLLGDGGQLLSMKEMGFPPEIRRFVFSKKSKLLGNPNICSQCIINLSNDEKNVRISFIVQIWLEVLIYYLSREV